MIYLNGSARTMRFCFYGSFGSMILIHYLRNTEANEPRDDRFVFFSISFSIFFLYSRLLLSKIINLDGKHRNSSRNILELNSRAMSIFRGGKLLITASGQMLRKLNARPEIADLYGHASVRPSIVDYDIGIVSSVHCCKIFTYFYQ